MSDRSEREGRGAEDLFAEFLDQREGHPSLTFDEWVRENPELEGELRALHEDYQRLVPHLPESGASAGGERPLHESLERGFEIKGEIGRGGYGRVLRARDRVLQREVALKVLAEEERITPAMRRRFLEEARVLARLDHPNIVRIHSVESDGDEIRLSLELVEGRTLLQIVEQDGPYAPEECARIGIELCRALAAIHAEGLVHMDVKPGNVMRAAGGRIVLLDFGFARPSKQAAGSEGSPIGGTPPFMSPEHFEGRTDIGARADVYSLGVLLYWLLTGRYPYDYDDFAALSAQVLGGRPKPLLDARPDIPRELVQVVEKAMARNEDERFASAGELEEALRRVLAGTGEPPSAKAKAAPTSRRGLLAVTGVALVAAVGLWLLPPVSGDEAFRIEHAFYRLSDEDSIRLEDGDSLFLDDRLYVEVRSPEPFYLYVFNQDERGNWYRLVPDGESPPWVQEDTLQRFPPRSWIVDSEGETEHLHVIASPDRVPWADALVSIIPPTGKNQGQLTRGERKRLNRGIGSEAEGEDLPVFDLKEYLTKATSRPGGGERIYLSHETFRNEGTRDPVE